MILRWENPPEKRNAGRWQHALADLQAWPGRWALLCESEEAKYAYDTVASAMKRRGAEVRTQMKAGKVSVWARWPEATSACG